MKKKIFSITRWESKIYFILFIRGKRKQYLLKLKSHSCYKWIRTKDFQITRRRLYGLTRRGHTLWVANTNESFRIVKHK